MLSSALASPPAVARSIARWMFSRGMLTLRARSIASRNRKFPSGFAPPSFAASMISLVILVKTTPRLTSAAPFWRLIWLHFECPDIERDTTNAPFAGESLHGITGAHEDQKRGRRRPRGIGQDEPRRVHPPRRRRDDAPRQSRRRHEHPRHRSRRAEAPHHDQHGPRVLPLRRHQ